MNEATKYIIAIIGLLGGIGTLLIAFQLLQENIGKLANSGLKKLFSKTSKNPFIGVAIGTAVTVIIQSSGATTIMIVGFVNAGMMNLFQATAMIMGANIGTTITAQIAALGSLNGSVNAISISDLFLVLIFVGSFIYLLSKKDKIKTIGMALGGLGLIFLALNFMTTSMEVFKESPAFVNFLSSCNNPLLLLLFGVVFTAVMQSSSATTSIIIAMASAGLSIGSNPNDVLFVILGTNIGSCVTALLSSIGTSANARRASMIHLLFNLTGTLLFCILLLVWRNFMTDTLDNWFTSPGIQIAMFHTVFNLSTTALLLPFIKQFVKLSNLIIKDKNSKISANYLDERFLKTPSVALSLASKEILNLGRISIDALSDAIDGFVSKDVSKSESVNKQLKKIDELNNEILEYMVKVSNQSLSVENDNYLAALYHCINDFYREAEIADNVLKYTRSASNGNMVFSEEVFIELNHFKEILMIQFENIEKLFLNHDNKIADKINLLENEMDSLRSKMINDHIDRLEKGECRPISSGVFINLVSNLERAGDHLNYIAQILVNV